MRWLFPGKEVRIDVPCVSSGAMMTIRMKDDDILEMTPDSVVGHMNVPFSAIASGKAGVGFA